MPGRSALISGNQAVAEIAEGPVYWLDEQLPDIVVIVTNDTGGFVDYSIASSIRLNISRRLTGVTLTPTSTLLAAIDDSIVTLDTIAGEGVLFPDPAVTGNFFIEIDNEVMEVTARTVDELTVTRGVEGTTAASHLILAPFELVLIGVGTNVVETRGEERFIYPYNLFTSPGQYLAQVAGTFSGNTQRSQRFSIEVLESVPGEES